MDWIKGRAIYKPIEALFYAPVYNQTVQICWEKKYYLSQKKMLVQLMRLQQQKRIPSELTADDMTDWLVERSKKSLRERLWKFSLEEHDETIIQPLLMLTWQVNINMKMRDMAFEARMVLDSPEADSPCYQEPQIMRLAEEAISGLTERQQQDPGSSLLSPRDVAIQLVPKVLQGFWLHPSSLSSVMPSIRLSPLAVGATKAVLDQLSTSLTSMEHQITFSRSTRDEKALGIQEKVRGKYQLDILVEKLNQFAPEVLSTIVNTTVEEISVMFEPPKDTETSEVLDVNEVELAEASQPAVGDEIESSTTHDGDLSKELSLEVETPADPEMDSAVVSAPLDPLTPPAEAPAITAAQEDLNTCQADIEEKLEQSSNNTTAEANKKNRFWPFFPRLFQAFCCCYYAEID